MSTVYKPKDTLENNTAVVLVDFIKITHSLYRMKFRDPTGIIYKQLCIL